jgi:hypothetical protein
VLALAALVVALADGGAGGWWRWCCWRWWWLRGSVRAADNPAPACRAAQVSVHPLMQHIPLRVLKSRTAKGLHPHIPFATVVTDFTTCHNTWFDKGEAAGAAAAGWLAAAGGRAAPCCSQLGTQSRRRHWTASQTCRGVVAECSPR